MNVTREPFDMFEVELVGEYSDNHGSTYMEPVIGSRDQHTDEAIGFVYTVYGHRTFPDVDVSAPEVEFVDGGVYWVNGIPTSMKTYHAHAAWLVEVSKDTTGYGATAIGDFEDCEAGLRAAIDLAFALAAGRPDVGVMVLGSDPWFGDMDEHLGNDPIASLHAGG